MNVVRVQRSKVCVVEGQLYVTEDECHMLQAQNAKLHCLEFSWIDHPKVKSPVYTKTFILIWR